MSLSLVTLTPTRVEGICWEYMNEFDIGKIM